jgi:hypothetical protein
LVREYSVHVRPRLELRSASSILLPPGAEYRVQTSLPEQSLEWSVLTPTSPSSTSSSLVSVDSTGLITAASRLPQSTRVGSVGGSSVVHIATKSSADALAVQSASVHVQVEAPVSLALLLPPSQSVHDTLPCMSCPVSPFDDVSPAPAPSSSASSSSAASSDVTSLRMCAGTNRTLHVAARDRLGRLFSSLSRWKLELPSTSKWLTAASLLSTTQMQGSTPIKYVLFTRFFLSVCNHC